MIILFFFEHLNYEKLRVLYLFKADKVHSFQRFLTFKY